MNRLAVAILVAILTCSGIVSPPAAFAADVTGMTAIQRNPILLNRQTGTFDTSVTVTNTGQASFRAPLRLLVITLPATITLSNRSGNSPNGVPYIDIALPNGALNQGQSVAVALKFLNPTRQVFTVTFGVEADNGASGALPSDPGEAGKATVAGIDSNNNGVRDDVERYIAMTVTDSARHRAALMQMAAIIQHELLEETKAEAIQFANQGVRSIDCLFYLGVADQDQWKKVEALALNTKPRILAMEAHSDRINGQVFGGIDQSQWRSTCLFDVEALPN